MARKNIPARSASQYGAAEAVRASKSRKLPRAMAREMIRETPPAKRRQFARELAARRRNQPTAAELSEKFHGRPVERVTMLEEPVRERAHLAELGQLIEIDITSLAEEQLALSFEHTQVRLCASPGGGQLYLAGGDQQVDVESFGIEETRKDFVVLGAVDEIVYYTAKAMDDFKPHSYFHELGEESGQRPVLIYDRLNQSLQFVGGHYTTRPEGLVD